MDSNVIVSLRNIGVEFDGEKVLKGLNLDIHDKEFVTLLGPSGCGKTTTLRIIGGFINPNEGDVYFGGQKLTICHHTKERLTPFSKDMHFFHT